MSRLKSLPASVWQHRAGGRNFVSVPPTVYTGIALVSSIHFRYVSRVAFCLLRITYHVSRLASCFLPPVFSLPSSIARSPLCVPCGDGGEDGGEALSPLPPYPASSPTDVKSWVCGYQPSPGRSAPRGRGKMEPHYQNPVGTGLGRPYPGNGRDRLA